MSAKTENRVLKVIPKEEQNIRKNYESNQFLCQDKRNALDNPQLSSFSQDIKALLLSELTSET
jgi:hypothetical protein